MYKNLCYVNLLSLKNEHKHLEPIFIFLDCVHREVSEVSNKNLNNNRIIFIDYLTKNEYYVDYNEANRILKKCYNDYFIKLILNKVGNLEIFIDIKEKDWFFFFIGSLFKSIKNGLNRNIKIDLNFLSKCIINFSNSKIDYQEMVSFIESVNLEELIEKFNFCKFISYELFELNKTGQGYQRFNQYALLILLSKQHYFDKFERVDQILHLIVMVSFKNATYNNERKKYNDSSIIFPRQKLPELEKPCQHFNNI